MVNVLCVCCVRVRVLQQQCSFGSCIMSTWLTSNEIENKCLVQTPPLTIGMVLYNINLEAKLVSSLHVVGKSLVLHPYFIGGSSHLVNRSLLVIVTPCVLYVVCKINDYNQ